MLFSNNVVFADGTIYTDGPLQYTIASDGNITIIDYFGDSNECKIPMAIGEHIVTKIASGAFKYSNVTKVELPDTITSISESAFNNIGSIQITYFDVNDAQVKKDNPIVEDKKPAVIVDDKDDDKDPVDDKKDIKDPTDNKKDDKKTDDKKDIKDSGGNKTTHEKKETEEYTSTDEINEEGLFVEEDIDLEDIFEEDEELDNIIDSNTSSKNETEEKEPIGIVVDSVSKVTINPITYVLIAILIVAIIVVIIKRNKKNKNV